MKFRTLIPICTAQDHKTDAMSDMRFMNLFSTDSDFSRTGAQTTNNMLADISTLTVKKGRIYKINLG